MDDVLANIVTLPLRLVVKRTAILPIFLGRLLVLESADCGIGFNVLPSIVLFRAQAKGFAYRSTFTPIMFRRN